MVTQSDNTQTTAPPSFRATLEALQATEGLPAQWLDDALQHFAPLAMEIARRRQGHQGLLVVGINGAQGTGKTTLAHALSLMLEHDLNLNTAVLSLDDFYLTRQERLQLADCVHPLLATRGVPGTHDITLALQTLDMLAAGEAPTSLPRFDKSIDDRAAQSAWPVTKPSCDIVILEGWCLGLQAETDQALALPVNELEAAEDADASWRRFVNQKLDTEYQQLFARADMLIMLKAPSFDKVFEWRCLQEEKLAQRSNSEQERSRFIMTPDAIQRFIQHYERLTRHCIATLPDVAELTFFVDDNHCISHCTRNPKH